MYRSKRFEYKNENEDNSPNILSDETQFEISDVFINIFFYRPQSFTYVNVVTHVMTCTSTWLPVSRTIGEHSAIWPMARSIK